MVGAPIRRAAFYAAFILLPAVFAMKKEKMITGKRMLKSTNHILKTKATEIRFFLQLITRSAPAAS